MLFLLSDHPSTPFIENTRLHSSKIHDSPPSSRWVSRAHRIAPEWSYHPVVGKKTAKKGCPTSWRKLDIYTPWKFNEWDSQTWYFGTTYLLSKTRIFGAAILKYQRGKSGYHDTSVLQYGTNNNLHKVLIHDWPLQAGHIGLKIK